MHSKLPLPRGKCQANIALTLTFFGMYWLSTLNIVLESMEGNMFEPQATESAS